MVQEESGIYGAFVIEPQEETLDYDKELVMVLSDWTNEKPMNVLRNLKRGNEWYEIKKGTATPLNQVIARGALGAQLNFWKQRMGGDTQDGDMQMDMGAFAMRSEIGYEHLKSPEKTNYPEDAPVKKFC